LTDARVSRLTLDDESHPHIVLLASSSDPHRLNRDQRVRRQAVNGNASEDSASLTRGYAQNDEFIKDVDITEENINKTIQSQNLSVSNVSTI
jgi:hypothetical protein